VHLAGRKAADAARVDDPAAGGEPVELHVGVPADHRPDLGAEPDKAASQRSTGLSTSSISSSRRGEA
jgi:hypothetical protein